VRPRRSSWRLTKQRSSVLAAMCDARRSTVCRVAVTSDIWIGAASTLEIALQKAGRQSCAAQAARKQPQGRQPSFQTADPPVAPWSTTP
jgi:hypothetical protein